MFHILALALAASLAPAQVTDPQPPAPITGLDAATPTADVRPAVGGGVHVRLYAVTGKASNSVAGASCATPANALPAGIDAAAIARTFGGDTATRLWHPSLSAQGPLRFFGATRLEDGRLFLGLVGQADEAGTWNLHLTLRDMERPDSSGRRDLRLAPGGEAWFAERFRGQCIVARVSADGLPGRPLPAATPAEAADDDTADEPRSMTREITPPVLVKPVAPRYPMDARKQRRAGTTMMEVVIDTGGSVTSASVLTYPEGSEDLAFEALAAVSQWKYRPAAIAGQPVRVRFSVQVTYRPE